MTGAVGVFAAIRSSTDGERPPCSLLESIARARMYVCASAGSSVSISHAVVVPEATVTPLVQ
jgi:hypothetical protein